MYCKKCGEELPNGIKCCPKCGTPVEANVVVNESNNRHMNGLQLASFIFMLLTTIGTGIFLIPLCWTIPMTVHYYKKVNKGEQVGIGFMICSLLFVNLIAGILMLIDSSQSD